jgi:hypothetical protein
MTTNSMTRALKRFIFPVTTLVMALGLAAPSMATHATAGSDDEARRPAARSAAGDAGQLASFRGETIDMSRGWKGAQSCIVFTKTRASCYPTHRQANAALGYSPALDLEIQAAKAIGAAAIPDCAYGWVCLYQYKNGGGKRLIFSDGYWHDLYNYGFNDKTSSWRNNKYWGDNAYLSQHTGGGGATRWLDSDSYVSDLGWFDNRVSAVQG